MIPTATVWSDRSPEHPGHLRRGRAVRGHPGRGRRHDGGSSPRPASTTSTSRPATARPSWLGPFLERHRVDFFLATKTGERTAAAYAEICRSLELLRTDHVDLLQLHNLVDEDEWRTAYAPGGALEAAVRAKEEGLVHDSASPGTGSPWPASTCGRWRSTTSSCCRTTTR